MAGFNACPPHAAQGRNVPAAAGFDQFSSLHARRADVTVLDSKERNSVEINQTTPQAAHAALTADREAVYLDVRTEEEFAAGHPAGAINVPISIPNLSGGMLLNPDFQRLVESLFPRDKPIFCGCQVGVRSQTAAEILSEI